nr:DUF3168 domain-containing protein [uncultured Cohaesibacter sp.]
MTLAAAELEAATHARLIADTDLTDLLGGAKVYALAPRKASFPYVTLTVSLSRDWSTGTEDGQDHRLILTVWTAMNRRDQLAALLDRLSILMQMQGLTLPNHHLVNLLMQSCEIRADQRNRALQGLLQMRAVTEPITT